MTPDTPVPVARPENEAADLWPICIHEAECSFLAWDQTTRCNCRTNDIILAALATERRLTVERIARRISQQWSGATNSLSLLDIKTILDEEANR